MPMGRNQESGRRLRIQRRKKILLESRLLDQRQVQDPGRAGRPWLGRDSSVGGGRMKGFGVAISQQVLPISSSYFLYMPTVKEEDRRAPGG